MKQNIFFGVALALVVSLAGCSKDSGRSGRLARPISNEQLKQELAVLSDTLAGKWNVMMWSDSIKTQQMEEILAAIPPAALGSTQRAQLQHALRRLQTLRYDRTSVRDSDRIDAYDQAQDSVWNAIRAFLPETGPTGIARVDSLNESITAHHSETVFYRGRYDQTAKELNTLLRRYKGQIPQLGKPYDTLQPAPLFQWVDKDAPVKEEEEEQ
ncbi:hypothetical protein ACD591_15080 [Rufibacter glacialis]|uniref:LemA family protein n=1 Tax=Rufibacter glacialis TaxID=1259555 RepID=A0A5M8QRW6_9BACT|nr:hypothetical protein [Rufibacter glacialis]KAA6437724.1 hypothetical protein FOE74_04255 [Rufibacter glacialis]